MIRELTYAVQVAPQPGGARLMLRSKNMKATNAGWVFRYKPIIFTQRGAVDGPVVFATRFGATIGPMTIHCGANHQGNTILPTYQGEIPGYL